MKILILKAKKVVDNFQEIVYDSLDSCEGYLEVNEEEYKKLVYAISFFNSKSEEKLEIVSIYDGDVNLSAFLNDFKKYSREENERLEVERQNERKLAEEKRQANALAKKKRAVKQLAKKLGISEEEVEARL